MAQAKIERLKLLLGKDFPQPLPKPVEAKPAPIVPPPVAVTGSAAQKSQSSVIAALSEDSEPDTSTQPSVDPPQKKSKEKKPNTPPLAHRPLRPFSERTVLFDIKGPNIGRLADIGTSFCPIVAISKYPYKFVPYQLSVDIAHGFFDDGKFWYRPWDIYYVWPPALLTSKPLLLVSTDQVEQFLQEINGAIDGCYLTLGSEAEEFGLVLKFPSHPGLRPRYLGNSTSREMFSSMERGVPDSEHRPPGESRPSAKPERTTLEDWQYMMGLAFEVSKGKNKAAKAAKKDQRTAKQQQWKDDLKRAERFLGFRPGVLGLPEPAEDASWDDVQAYHAAKAQHNVLQAVNPEALPPYPFDKLPVFVCVDVECYEHDKSKVTEIGVAMLDTADLEGLSPGANGGNWHQKIKARHLRVKEHAHLRNGNFVSDAAEKFEFPEGGSEFVDLADAPRAIATCFREPFCKTDRDEAGLAKSQSQSTEENEIADAEDGGADLPQKEPAVQSSREEAHSDESYPKPPESESPKRTLILVGHDIASDIRYLRRVGYDLGNLSNLHTTLDTASLQRALVHEWNPKSLAGVLYDFDLTGWHQHNAGNDAVYTLWAMVAVVLKSATQRGDESVRKKHEERKVGRVQEAVVRAGTQAIEEGEGWSSGGEEEGPSVQAAKPPAEQKPSEEQRSEDEPAGADDYGGGMKVF